MKVLGLDTSTLTTSIAVLEDEKILGEISLMGDMSHSERLTPMIKELMEDLNLNIADIDLYGVAKGPGSFTGLRIGLATVKALAQVNKKPIIGISSLEGLAYNTSSGITIPIIDARRDRVYTGIYKWENGQLINLKEPYVTELDQLLDEIENNYENIIVNGPGLFEYAERFKNISEINLAKGRVNYSNGAAIARLAYEKYSAGLRDDFYNLSLEYLSLSQAERVKKNG